MRPSADAEVTETEVFGLADVPQLSADHQRKVSHQLGLPDVDLRRKSQEHKGTSDIPTMFQGRKLSKQILLVYQAHRLSAIAERRQSHDKCSFVAHDEHRSIDLQARSTRMRTRASMSR
jgi:hypothetical protein